MFPVIRLLVFALIFGPYLTNGSLLFSRARGKHNVTRDECADAINFKHVHKICCHVKKEDDPVWKQCLEVQGIDFPTKDNSLELVYLSLLAECIFTNKNYMKSNDRLNMKRIRADAKRLYGNDSMRRHFMVNMYKECGRRSAIRIDDVKQYPENDEIINSMHKPYFAFILKCIYFYSYIKCPYFRWEGLNEADAKTCADYVAQCRKGY